MEIMESSSSSDTKKSQVVEDEDASINHEVIMKMNHNDENEETSSPATTTAGVKLRKKSSTTSSSASASRRSLVTQSQIYPSTQYDTTITSSIMDDDDKYLRRKSSIGLGSTRSSAGSNYHRSSNTTERHSSGLFGSEPIKMSGYLEKRSKMIGWKRFWFVLDGHLLTYYKSKVDYESLSACCGSINLGIASTVCPLQIKGCKGYPLQITTRSQIYYLRSLDKPILEKWLLALQETTSAPPEISSPTWTDPGVQFYRYSFAPGSQWSLANSTDDISGSLSNLPKNFYLKSSKTSSSGMKKCQSLASLQPSTLLGPDQSRIGKMSSLLPPTSTKGHKSNPRLNPALNDSNQMNGNGNGRVRQSASMLVLESSTPAAVELRKELTMKLTSGNLFPSKQAQQQALTHQKMSLNNGTMPEDDELQEVRDGKSEDLKLETTRISSPHYDEIIDFEANYPRSSAMSSTTGSSASETDLAHQTSTNNNINDDYEPVQVTSVSSNSNNNNNGLSGPWEKRIEYGGSNRNSLISISELPENHHHQQQQEQQWKSSSTSTNNNSIGKGRSNNYQASSMTSNNDFSASSQSINSGSSASPNNSFKKKKGLGGFFHKIFNKDEYKKAKARDRSNSNTSFGSNKDISSSSSSYYYDYGSNGNNNMVISGPVDLRSMMPNYNKKYESPLSSSSSLNNSRKQSETSSSNQMLNASKTQTDNNKPKNTNSNGEKGQKLPSNVIGGQNVFQNDSVLAELKTKVGQIKKTEAENNKGAKVTESKIENFQNPKAFIQSPEKENNQTIPTQSHAKLVKKQSDGTSSGFLVTVSTTAELEEMLREENVRNMLEEDEKSQARDVAQKRPTSKEEYQDKLAKFNRLSAHLNPTFIAALNKSSAVGTSIDSNNDTNNGALGRSNSLSVKLLSKKNSIEEMKGLNNPPMLPPKKKPKDTLNNVENYDGVPETGEESLKNKLAYDVPKNNTPIVTDDDIKNEDSEITTPGSKISPPPIPSRLVDLSLYYAREKCNDNDDNAGERKIRLLRDLTKKNSAPDVVFPQSRKSSITDSNSHEIGLLPSILHGSADVSRMNEEVQLNIEGPIQIQCNCNELNNLLLPPVINYIPSSHDDFSPPTSVNKLCSKSIDNIDNLDALSDISSTLPTPPNTPFLSENLKQGNLPSSFLPFFPPMTDNNHYIESTLNYNNNNNQALHPQQPPDGDVNNPYENLQLKYATINTLVTELETVEETEDEMIELYDDFSLTEFIQPIPPPVLATATRVEPIDEEDGEDEDVFPEEPKVHRMENKFNRNKSSALNSSSSGRVQSVRHSGIDELQKYLSSESNDFVPSASQINSSPITTTTPLQNIMPSSSGNSLNKPSGVINRLGHSAAIDQLHKLVHNNNNNTSSSSNSNNFSSRNRLI